MLIISKISSFFWNFSLDVSVERGSSVFHSELLCLSLLSTLSTFLASPLQNDRTSLSIWSKFFWGHFKIFYKTLKINISTAVNADDDDCDCDCPPLLIFWTVYLKWYFYAGSIIESHQKRTFLKPILMMRMIMISKTANFVSFFLL